MLDKKVEDILLRVEKPARYVGGETGRTVKDKDKIDIRFAFCFPDVYEIGMSHLGLKILYSMINALPYAWCERVFTPWVDMEQLMIQNDIPLYALESYDPINEFDIIGFTLQYELSYSNVLNMLKLAKIPLKSEDRTELSQLVVAGGPCACNPEPLHEFIDVFFPGEGEEVLKEFLELYRESKRNNESKDEFLKKAVKIEGVYVPKFYDVRYNSDGTIEDIINKPYAPKKVVKRIVKDLDNSHYPTNFPVPLIEIVHDRVEGEIFRGCIRGCRFCQAGFIYRPVREKSSEVINKQIKTLCDVTGYDELSLCSLSSSDYSNIETLLETLSEWTDKERVSISLPSLRVNSLKGEISDKLKNVRRSGLTFAPEAGSQRLRDVINKNVTEEEIMSTCSMAFSGGWSTLKLYFMMGLPTETDEDIVAIAELAQRVVDLYYNNPNRSRGKAVRVNISVACFVPKANTPFQWEPQDSRDNLRRKQKLLKDSIRNRKIKCSYHDNGTSFLEAVFARGDRKLSKVLLKASEEGMKFDGWSEYFNLDKWLKIMEECDIDPNFYANRERQYNEILPWDHIDYKVKKEFLIEESKKAHKDITTPNCREKCSNCGALYWKGGICLEKH